MLCKMWANLPSKIPWIFTRLLASSPMRQHAEVRALCLDIGSGSHSRIAGTLWPASSQLRACRPSIILQASPGSSLQALNLLAHAAEPAVNPADQCIQLTGRVVAPVRLGRVLLVSCGDDEVQGVPPAHDGGMHMHHHERPGALDLRGKVRKILQIDAQHLRTDLLCITVASQDIDELYKDEQGAVEADGPVALGVGQVRRKKAEGESQGGDAVRHKVPCERLPVGTVQPPPFRLQHDDVGLPGPGEASEARESDVLECLEGEVEDGRPLGDIRPIDTARARGLEALEDGDARHEHRPVRLV
mmetsp:Transcript_2299/g.6569  ORF Transcript_2299/g.6569 Transcript_2299/m.6569 type:complete len:302 (-) Transcript_2299:843-1748(-)